MSDADNARKSNTPWRGRTLRKVPVNVRADGQNAAKQRRALNRMSLLELQTGRTEAEWDAWHAEQRARVLARYGVR